MPLKGSTLLYQSTIQFPSKHFLHLITWTSNTKCCPFSQKMKHKRWSTKAKQPVNTHSLTWSYTCLCSLLPPAGGQWRLFLANCLTVRHCLSWWGASPAFVFTTSTCPNVKLFCLCWCVMLLCFCVAHVIWLWFWVDHCEWWKNDFVCVVVSSLPLGSSGMASKQRKLCTKCNLFLGVNWLWVC